MSGRRGGEVSRGRAKRKGSAAGEQDENGACCAVGEFAHMGVLHMESANILSFPPIN